MFETVTFWNVFTMSHLYNEGALVFDTIRFHMLINFMNIFKYFACKVEILSKQSKDQVYV